MKITFSKNNIIQFLLLLVVLLLAVNILFEKLYKAGSAKDEKVLSSRVINERFLAALNNYNMDSSWITLKKKSSKDDDSLKYMYKVDVPGDLPVSLLIREIQNQFDTNEVNIESTEFRKNNSTELRIASGGFAKLKALMANNKVISRNTDTIGFILTGIGNLNNDEINSLMLIPEYFAGILIPSKHSQVLLKTLRENQKEAAVLLNDDISELEFKLNTGYSSKRIKSSIVSIIGKFYKAAFFIIDETSDIYKSEHYKLIREEFAKRGIPLLLLGNFTELDKSSGNGLLSRIRKGEYNDKIFRVSAGEFLEMPPLLAALRKTGNKFVRPSLLIGHQTGSR